MQLATFISWLLTAGLGAFMLRTWLARGGLRRERARAGGLPPQLIAGHAGLAVGGLVIWIAYLGCGARALAWTAVGLLMVTVGLGLCTVTLWTPYPARKPGERRTSSADQPTMVVPETAAAAADGNGSPEHQVTDEMIARLIEQPGRDYAQWHRPVPLDLAVLVPIAHGLAAIGTFVLAVMTAAM
ncbi:MAG TPA: hypothetical protein VMG38_15720 [Trebonia sp.]|nr:hypothetical protein [Trebonia sp.]